MSDLDKLIAGLPTAIAASRAFTVCLAEARDAAVRGDRNAAIEALERGVARGNEIGVSMQKVIAEVNGAAS